MDERATPQEAEPPAAGEGGASGAGREGKEEDAAGEEHSLCITVNGQRIGLVSDANALSTTTGWTTWDSAHVVIKYLEATGLVGAGRSAMDISTGNGLVALAMAALGASSVIATEVEACVQLTRRNVAANLDAAPSSAGGHFASRVHVREYAWGDAAWPSGPTGAPGIDVAVVCDSLFIAIRDGVEDLLMETLRESVGRASVVVFAYEERVCEKENAFMDRLKERVAHAEEVPAEDLDLDAARLGETAYDPFYERPPVRLWLLRGALRGAMHKSGLWIGEAAPNPAFEGEVPVNPIRWTATAQARSVADGGPTFFGCGYFSDAQDIPGSPVLTYLLRGDFDESSGALAFEKAYAHKDVPAELVVAYTGKLELRAEGWVIAGSWANAFEQTCGTFACRLEDA